MKHRELPKLMCRLRRKNERTVARNAFDYSEMPMMEDEG
jgi:hypothetical protein